MNVEDGEKEVVEEEIVETEAVWLKNNSPNVNFTSKNISSHPFRSVNRLFFNIIFKHFFYWLLHVWLFTTDNAFQILNIQLVNYILRHRFADILFVYLYQTDIIIRKIYQTNAWRWTLFRNKWNVRNFDIILGVSVLYFNSFIRHVIRFGSNFHTRAWWKIYSLESKFHNKTGKRVISIYTIHYLNRRYSLGTFYFRNVIVILYYGKFFFKIC